MDNYGFKNIAGYEDVKEELVRILKWYKVEDKTIVNNIDLPKGIVFYGDSGCGKTTLMFEFAEMFNYPIFCIEGKMENLIEEFNNVFSAVKEEKNAVVVINDLDLLVCDNYYIQRLLMQELDSIINKKTKIIVLATLNDVDFDAILFRNGRFDRFFEIGTPKNTDIRKIINYYINKFNINLEENDLEYLTNVLTGCSGVDIKCIVEDAYLITSGNVTAEDIENSWYMIYYKKRFNNQEKDLNGYNYEMVAIHEAGHVLLSYKNRDLINFYRATIQRNNDALGGCKTYPVLNTKYSLETIIAKIEIGIAGYLAQKIICNYRDSGAITDLSDAKYYASTLINDLGYKGLKYITNIDEDSDYTPNEKIINKLLRKKEKEVTKYIIKNKHKLLLIAEALINHGSINKKELFDIMNN